MAIAIVPMPTAIRGEPATIPLTSETSTKEFTLRADARRNRERVLAAALETFAQEGLGVTVAEIARRAGVGTGTVSRHFPTNKPYDAILEDRVQNLKAEAEAEATALAERLERGPPTQHSSSTWSVRLPRTTGLLSGSPRLGMTWRKPQPVPARASNDRWRRFCTPRKRPERFETTSTRPT